MLNNTNDPKRRLQPRPWDHDFIAMRQMAGAYRTLIARNLRAGGELTVVDFGCGSMPYRSLFTGYAARYLGADLATNTEAEITIDEKGRLPLADRSVDVVLSSQVLEHVLDVRGYLEEAQRVLRTDGALLLSTHGMWIYHPHPTDVRRWTRWGLRYDIEQCGFEVVDTMACVGPLAYATQLQQLLIKGFLLKLGIVGKILIPPISLLCQGAMWLQDRITPKWLTEDNASVYVMVARPVRGRP